MPDRPRLHKQETVYSCGPACLRMVLEAFGLSKTEGELRELTNCTLEGTTPDGIVTAARVLGFAATRVYTPTFEELSQQIAVGLYPIVSMYSRLEPGLPPDWHCVVSAGVSERRVELLDPWRGECSISIEEFLRDWIRPTSDPPSGLTILVQA